MKHKLPYLLVALISCISLKAQNLVPNPSFELYSDIPDGTGQINYCKYWYTATTGSPDYFNTATSYQNISIPHNIWGYQDALNGNCYVGIYTYNKIVEYGVEYIETKLVSPLIGQKCYNISYYVSLSDSMSWYALNNIGAYFSADSIYINQTIRLNQFTPQIVNPQTNPLTDKSGWTKVSGTFIAEGNERYLLLGNFNLPQNDDTVFVGSLANTPRIYSYIYIDSVSVQLCGATGIEENEIEPIKIFPNPANEILTISVGKMKNAQIEIFDITGQKLFQQRLSSNKENIDVSSLSNGVYICVITSNNQIVKREKVIIQR